jgi:hypothetical protein
MHRPETKIKRGLKILCNKPSEQTEPMKTNAECWMENLWNHFFVTASAICGVKSEQPRLKRPETFLEYGTMDEVQNPSKSECQKSLERGLQYGD